MYGLFIQQKQTNTNRTNPGVDGSNAWKRADVFMNFVFNSGFAL